MCQPEHGHPAYGVSCFCCAALFEIAVCRCPGIQRFKVNLALVAGSVPKFKYPILDSAERAETFAISLHNIQWAHTWVSAGCNIRLSSMCGFAFLPAPLGMVRSIASGACNLVEISSPCRFFPFTCLEGSARARGMGVRVSELAVCSPAWVRGSRVRRCLSGVGQIGPGEIYG